MKAIYSVVFYISLAIALCSPNVSMFCGNDKQIEDLQTALMTQESIYTVMTTLSAIPVTGAALTLAQVMISGQFALHLNGVFEEMGSSLNKDHIDYGQCSTILEEIVTASTIIRSTSHGFSFVSLIPGLGLALLPPRLGGSITAMLLIK
ncbi:uncharacterized protein LOC132934121 [Metopolophium dirhodum]|uniref:uncharacterized protein LOC132934119 n=1 Tax=Metopolophium dirhodum TaxID=44670 RepID=UPI00298F829A|nr:uncharacterized protein LOC132934119 [Metopolophium dirhodum]XP_060856378.1 uncharacterized protein LOC132934121 [Metopolophium dirhodum]